MSPFAETADAWIMRALLGALAAAAVAALARRAGALTTSGQWMAFVTGTAATAAGWGWAALLVGYFVLSAALTRWGAERKRARTLPMLSGGSARRGVQVAANGGLFAVLVLAGELRGDGALLVAGMGALAAAAADTWATEVGLLFGGTPRSVRNGAPVAPGESGGVTLAGFAASAAAALLFAALTGLLQADPGLPSGRADLAVLLAAMSGSVADSILGATLQSKRWCDQCRTWTERRVHNCSYRTHHARGIRWMTNDTVNFLATVVGALVALLAFGALG